MYDRNVKGLLELLDSYTNKRKIDLVTEEKNYTIEHIEAEKEKHRFDNCYKIFLNNPTDRILEPEYLYINYNFESDSCTVGGVFNGFFKMDVPSISGKISSARIDDIVQDYLKLKPSKDSDKYYGWQYDLHSYELLEKYLSIVYKTLYYQIKHGRNKIMIHDKNTVQKISLMCMNCFNLMNVDFSINLKCDNSNIIAIDYDNLEIPFHTIKINCPQCNNVAEFVPLDTNIAEIVSILNKKGYYTHACCEGHFAENGFDPGTYIAFIENINKFNIPIPSCCSDPEIDPNDEIERRFLGSALFINYEDKFEFDENARLVNGEEIPKLIEYQKQSLLELLQWAKDLPNRNV